MSFEPASKIPAMSSARKVILFFSLLFVFSSKGEYYGHLVVRCQSRSPDGHDAVYLEQYYFNKKLEVLYNSTMDKLVGYTKEGQDLAEFLNNDSHFMKHERWKTNLCKNNIPKSFDSSVLKAVEPKVWLRAVEAMDGQHPRKLICSLYDFYPKQIKVTWLRNGKELTSNVMSTDEMPSGNWLYQLHSQLEFTPKSGENITCMVEHASLRKPKLYHWVPQSNPNMSKYVVGIAALLLGLLFSLTGFIYYKKKSFERVMVPTSEVLYPDNAL